MLEASEYKPPVSNRPNNSNATPTMGWRRFCESAFTLWIPYILYNRMRCDKYVPVYLGCDRCRAGGPNESLHDVDNEPQSDPHDIYEVPIVRHDNGNRGFVISKSLS